MKKPDEFAQVRRLGWISFYADIASEMAYPILPLFMRSLGAPAAGLGLVEGVAEAIVSFMKGFSGVQSDKMGRRKPFIFWGYLLSTLGKPLIAAAFVWPMVLIARGLDRVGKGVRTTARDALITESAPEGKMGEAFGIHRAMDTAGAIIGVLITLALVQVFPENYRMIFLLAIIPGIVSVWMIRSIREKPGDVEKKDPWTFQELKSLPGEYWHALVISVLFAFANTSDTFLLMRAKDLGVSDSAAILLYALFNVAYAAIAYPSGRLSDRVGRRPIIAFGWAVYGLVYLGFTAAGSNLLWVLFAAYGLYQGFADGASKAIVADHSPKAHRGAAMGFFYMCVGLGTLFGNLGGGLLWDRLGPNTMFRLDGTLALISAALLLTLRRKPV